MKVDDDNKMGATARGDKKEVGSHGSGGGGGQLTSSWHQWWRLMMTTRWGQPLTEMRRRRLVMDLEAATAGRPWAGARDGGERRWQGGVTAHGDEKEAAGHGSGGGSGQSTSSSTWRWRLLIEVEWCRWWQWWWMMDTRRGRLEIPSPREMSEREKGWDERAGRERPRFFNVCGWERFFYIVDGLKNKPVRDDLLSLLGCFVDPSL